MFLEKLKLSNFRSYQNGEFSFSKKINCIVGCNGSGKTNMLDAIYYLSFTKSFLEKTDTANIKHGEDFFALHGFYKEFAVHCVQKKASRKIVKLDEKEYEKLSKHIGKVPLVMSCPQDQELVHGGSELRRKFVDGVISQYNNVYLEKLIEYQHILQQRNNLLKNGRADEALLNIFSLQLQEKGEYILLERKKFLDEFLDYFNKYFALLSQGKESGELAYKCSFAQYSSLQEALEANLQRDLILQYTSCGIHKDDIVFSMNQYPLKKIGSQGQIKSFALALRLSQWEYMKDKQNLLPILLFDDIEDKLDAARLRNLLEIISAKDFGQVFISDCKQDRLREVFDTLGVEYEVFDLDKG